MAKIPKPSKPKLPKPKKSLGQHIKDNTRSAAASGLRKNFGVLGQAVAKRYLSPPRVSTRIRVEPDSGNKKLNKKKPNATAPAPNAIEESGKLVGAAVEIVAGNATRGFARVSRQAETMGSEVSKSLEELTNVLDRLLYRKPAETSGEPAEEHRNRVVPKQEASGFNWMSLLKFLGPLAIIPVLKGIGLMSGSGGTATSREDMLGQIEKQNQDPRAQGAMKRVEAIQEWFKGWFGSKEGTGKKIIGDNENIIHKMTYTTEKISFTASNAIEFKTRATTSASSGQKPHSAGFFNDLLDKMIGGRGGGGYAGGGGMDGQGNGPSGGSSVRPNTSAGRAGNKTDLPDASKDKTGDYPENTERLKHQAGNLSGMDPKLMHVMKEASKDLPPGYHAEIISGHDARSTGTTNHPAGIAADIKIYDNAGRLVPYDRGGPGMDAYEKYHQSMVERGKVLYPNEKFIWGGTWISSAAGHGDPMHMQLVDPSVAGSSQTSGAYNDDRGAKGHQFEPYLMNDEQRAAYKQSIRDKINNKPAIDPHPVEQPPPPTSQNLAPADKSPSKDTFDDKSMDKKDEQWFGKKTSSYEGTDRGDLDHRPRQDAVQQEDFSTYMGVSNKEWA